VLQAGLGGEEGAVQVDGEHLLPLGELELLDRVHDLDAGIADQDVDAAEGRGASSTAGIHLVFVRHVHRDADRLARPPSSARWRRRLPCSGRR
jgi:hypothetical protein